MRLTHGKAVVRLHRWDASLWALAEHNASVWRPHGALQPRCSGETISQEEGRLQKVEQVLVPLASHLFPLLQQLKVERSDGLASLAQHKRDRQSLTIGGKGRSREFE